MLTKRTPGVAGVVGSGAKQHPRPNVSGQAQAFSFWSSSPMSKMASSEKRSGGSAGSRAGPGAGASSGEARFYLERAVCCVVCSLATWSGQNILISTQL